VIKKSKGNPRKNPKIEENPKIKNLVSKHRRTSKPLCKKKSKKIQKNMSKKNEENPKIERKSKKKSKNRRKWGAFFL